MLHFVTLVTECILFRREDKCTRVFLSLYYVTRGESSFKAYSEVRSVCSRLQMNWIELAFSVKPKDRRALLCGAFFWRRCSPRRRQPGRKVLFVNRYHASLHSVGKSYLPKKRRLSWSFTTTTPKRWSIKSALVWSAAPQPLWSWCRVPQRHGILMRYFGRPDTTDDQLREGLEKLAGISHEHAELL